MSNTLPMTMHADSLELAAQVVTGLTKLDSELSKGFGYVDLSAVVRIDGCVIGRVEMQDDFYVFVPNAKWFGGVVEVMED